MTLRTVGQAMSLVVALSIPAFAQVPAGPAVFVMAGANKPAVAVDSNGGRYIVIARGVRGQRFERDGTALGGEFEVSEYPQLAAGLPTAVANRDGTVFVAWMRGTLTIHGRVLDREGRPRGPEFRVDSSTAEASYPVVASVADAGFVVVWHTYSAILGRRYDTGGQPLGAEFAVASQQTTESVSMPSVAAAGDGSFLVAWLSDTQDFSSVTISSRRYAPDGQPDAPQTLVATEHVLGPRRPSVAAADDRGYVVAWNQWPDRMARFVDPSGHPMGDAFRWGEASPYEVPIVAADETGAFTPVWTAGWEQPSDEVRAQRFTAAGVPRGSEFIVDSTVEGIFFRHAATVDAVGNLWVVWGNFERGTLLQRYGGLLAEAATADTFPWPLSDGNGVLEPGEAVDLRTSWRNVNGAEQTFSGTLTNPKGPAGTSAWITDPGGDYGAVANGDVGACIDCFGVAVSAPAVRPVLHWDATADEHISPDAQGQHKRWRLHVGDSFTDVPRGSPYYRYVETLLHEGVTAGCGNGAFCPQGQTSREQMAALLLLSKEGSTYKAAPCGTPVFADVPPSSPFCPFVEELARRGITGGCGGGNFCPGGAVTREQMAVFVLRTLDPALDPPVCGTPVFADVPASSPYCRWIEELARRGIATGCGNGNFCPTAVVTREQMAVFLTQTFGLRLY